MALLPYSQIGDNLYADSSGKQFNINKGYRQYVQSPFDSQSQQLNQVYDMQRKNQLDLLKQQRDKAVSGFNQQKKDLAPQYQAQRNQSDVVNAQNVSRLRELMAANGISASGENVTGQSNIASSRQTSLNDINNNEQSAYKEIDRQIANANDPAQEQAIIQAIEAERASRLADAQAQYQQDLYSRQVDWREYAMQKARFDLEMANAKKGSSGGGGGGGRRSSGRKKSSSSSASTVKVTGPTDQDYINYLNWKTGQELGRSGGRVTPGPRQVMK
jgi:hypothetical protein